MHSLLPNCTDFLFQNLAIFLFQNIFSNFSCFGRRSLGDSYIFQGKNEVSLVFGKTVYFVKNFLVSVLFSVVYFCACIYISYPNMKIGLYNALNKFIFVFFLIMNVYLNAQYVFIASFFLLVISVPWFTFFFAISILKYVKNSFIDISISLPVTSFQLSSLWVLGGSLCSFFFTFGH